MATTKQRRMLLAKVGLDGHDRGIKILAQGLRERGVEVIYTGIHQSPTAVVSAAVQEAVDLVCISILSGSHMTLVPEVLSLLERRGAWDIGLVVGGFIPEEDERRQLEALGARKVFPQDMRLDDAVEGILALAR